MLNLLFLKTAIFTLGHSFFEYATISCRTIFVLQRIERQSANQPIDCEGFTNQTKAVFTVRCPLHVTFQGLRCSSSKFGVQLTVKPTRRLCTTSLWEPLVLSQAPPSGETMVPDREDQIRHPAVSF